MKAIEKLKQSLAAVGASLDEANSDFSLHCDAPPGYVWTANRMPSFSIHYSTSRETWLVKAIQLEMAALKMGLDKVTDEATLKEHQWNLDDDNWKASDDAPNHIDFI